MSNAQAAEYLASLPLEERRLNGQVYTPPHLVDFVLERAGYDGRRPVRLCKPTVVVLMLCSRVEAEKYREGAEAFVDRVFFQEEIECLAFLRSAIAA